MSAGRWNGKKLEDEEDEIRVGDLVWVEGKYKNDPWWPGQVHDPRDASEFALMHSREGCVLVVLYGDGSCSWCLPSEMVPFVENLDKMACGDSSKGFVNAVQRAVDDMCKIVESKMTCRCIPLEKRGHLARPLVKNYGIKAGGLLAPEVDFDRLHIPEDDPSEILAKLLDFARTASFDSVLEVGILRSRMSAYSYARRGCGLCIYTDRTIIEGLEDKSGAVNGPFHGPEVDEMNQTRKMSSFAHVLLNKNRVVRASPTSAPSLTPRGRTPQISSPRKCPAGKQGHNAQASDPTVGRPITSTEEEAQIEEGWPIRNRKAPTRFRDFVM